MPENNADREQSEEAGKDPKIFGRIKAGILFWVGTVIGLFLIVIITWMIIQFMLMLSSGH